LPEKVDIITIDAGWTKLESVLPAVKKFLKPKGVIIALLKPQYEAPQKTKKGVIPPELVDQVVEVAVSKIEELGFRIEQKIESPILGAGGNKEYLLGLNSK
jgi:23S rRNA (cytidine1920-2'-O)/16S rRNA (cytidine1409-2'-O)-methyltransferase